MDYMSPFEVSSGIDVVAIAKKYPDLLMRVVYIPTCDHGVPKEVSFENYMHFRKRMLEYRD